VFPAPTLLLTEGNQYLMGHPAPPDSFFLVFQAASFFMNVYGLPFPGPCPKSAIRPMFGAPTIVKASRSCTSENATDWIFDYVRGQYRLYLYHNREPMKIFDLNLPRPDVEEKWKRDFPFGWRDPDVIRAVRELGQVADRTFHERERSARRKLLTDLLATRQRVKEVLDAREGSYSHDDFLRYILWSEGVAYFAAYEAVSTMRGAPVVVTKVNGYVPYLIYTQDTLKPSLRRFRTVSSEPLTLDDLTVLGALMTGIAKETDREWRVRIILRETWIEDLLERAARMPH